MNTSRNSSHNWKSFVSRAVFFFFVLYMLIPLLLSRIQITPQATVQGLFLPVVFAASMLSFILIERNRLKDFHYSTDITQVVMWGTSSAIFFFLYLYQQSSWFGYKNSPEFILLGWVVYGFASIFLFLSIFHVKFASHFFEPLITSLIVVNIYSTFALILNNSSYFAVRKMTLAVSWLLSYTNKVTTVITPNEDPILNVGSFSAIIGPPCTGITSLLMFTALYFFAVFLDWEKLDKRKLFIALIIGSVGMVGVAFLRLYLLFFIGANISPRVALTGFHTNAGWMLFAAYYFAFFYKAYPFLKR